MDLSIFDFSFPRERCLNPGINLNILKISKDIYSETNISDHFFEQLHTEMNSFQAMVRNRAIQPDLCLNGKFTKTIKQIVNNLKDGRPYKLIATNSMCISALQNKRVVRKPTTQGAVSLMDIPQ